MPCQNPAQWPDLLVYARLSCSFASSTCSWSGCLAGWCCWRAVTPPRTRRSWCCGMRSRCCGGRSPARGRTGPTGRCSPRWPGCCPGACGCTGSSPRAPCWPGTAAWSASKWTYPNAPGRPPVQPGVRDAGGAAGAGEPALGIPAHPGRAARPRVPGRRGDDPPDPGRCRARSRAAAGVADLAAVPGSPGVRASLACDFLHVDTVLPAAPVRAVRDGDRDPDGAYPGRHRPPGPGPGPPSRPATC